MTIKEIAKQLSASRQGEEALVDVVAIHDIHDIEKDPLHTWRHPVSRTSWLIDLLPAKLTDYRVLVYSYEAKPFTAPGVGSTESILNRATNLVAGLAADRELENARNRPIVFVCHGFGGLLVKRALALASSRDLQHQRSIYTSTYGIIFLGTPHNGFSKATILAQDYVDSGPSHFMLSLLKSSELLNEINDQFAPLMKQFAIFNFWEELPMESKAGDYYIVEQDSAAPAWDDVEKCGMVATHATMTRFATMSDPRFRPLLEAISRYVKNAPTVIRQRWKDDAEMMIHKGQQAIDELRRSQAVLSPQLDRTPSDFPEWYMMDHKSNHYFTGRQKHAKRLRELIGPVRNYEAHCTSKVVVIYGLGGSGKTQFCIKYVEDNKHMYWGVFWIDASKDENVDSGYAAIGTQAGVGATKTSAIHWLSKRKLPWLLVLDNADDPDIDISSYFPSEGNGSVLITTRNPNAVEHATVGHLRFRGMEPVEAVRLLLKAAYSDQQNQAPPPTSPTRWQLAEGITVELGYLPLAIAHAGAAIRKNIYTLERYLKYYLPQRKSMLSHARDWSADELNIITTWETPFKKIVDRKSIEHKDAVDLMHIFAFMHHETIPVRIFERSWSGLKDDLPKSRSVPGILQSVWNESARARFRRAIGVLCDHSIIEYEPHKGLCTIHPVIHNWARNRLSDVEQMRWLRCATAILAHCISTNLETSGKEFRALSVAPMLETSGRQFRAQLVPHINSCFQMQRVQFSRKDETLQAAVEREKFAWAFAEQGQWNMARQIQEDLVRFRVKTLGKRHEDTIRAQNSLGQTLWNLFDVKAVPAMVDVQKDVIWVLWWNRPQLRDWAMWKPWQPTHTPYCLTMSELTNTLWLAGKRSIAKYTGERAVAGLTQRLGPEDPLTLRAMFHLARTYLHLEEVEKCHALLLWVLRLQKRFFGNDHPDTLMTRNELGILLCASKRHLSSAQRLVENVLRARKEIYGEEHAYTLWSVNDLAKIYTEVGRVDDAVALLEGIIPVVIRTLGEDHVGMTMTKGNLAKAYHLLERWEDASGCLLPLLEKLPRGHPDWVNATYGYARVLLKLGKLEEAENRCLGLMEQVESTKVFPRDHPRTVSIADLLVEIYRLQGRENMVAAIKSRVPKVGSVKNEDRYDPYGIRRGSHQPAKRLQSSTPVDQARRDSHQHPAQDLSPSRSRPRKQDPVAKLIVRRTF